MVAVGVCLIGGSITQAQTQAPSVINAANITQLQSIQHFDFSELPADISPASGQYVMNPDASRVVSFGNHADEAPASQALLWGYADTVRVNAIEGDSIVRHLTNDGKCLYAGYRGYYVIWELDD